MRTFAEIGWTADDVQTLSPEMSQREAEDFLARNQKHLRDRLIEYGWDVMETLLILEGHKTKE